MKKILAICMMMVMVACMSVTALAAPGGFVSSPSGNPAPTIVDFDSKDDGCTGHLVVTPYSERDTLSSDLKDLIENAYKEIAASDDLTKLNADLAKVAEDKKIAGKDLAVSDLFDIHVDGCNDHEDHVGFDITLDADTLNHFVGLLQMNKDGVWELVSGAEVINNGEQLKFSVDYLSSFAIVVDTSADAPQTSDNSMIYIYAIIMAVSALAIIAIAVKSKKQRA